MQLVDLGPQGQHSFPDDATPEEIQAAIDQLSTKEQRRQSLATEMARVRGQDRASRWLAGQTLEGAAPAALQETQRGVGETIKGVGAASVLMPPVEEMPSEPGVFTPVRVADIQRRAAKTPSQKMEEIQRSPIFIAGRALAETAEESHPVPPQAEGALATKVGRTVGSFVPPVASMGAAPIQIALQSAGAHINADYDAALAQKNTPDEAAEIAFKRATASGLTQAAIWAVLPKFLRTATDKWIIDKFAPSVGEKAVKRFLLGRVAQTAEMAPLGAASAGAEAAIAGQPVLPAMGEGAVGMGIIGGLSPRGISPREAAQYEAFLGPAKTAGIAPEIARRQAWAQTFGVGEGEIPTEMVRTSPDVLEPHRPPSVLLGTRAVEPFVPPSPGPADVREPGFPVIPRWTPPPPEQPAAPIIPAASPIPPASPIPAATPIPKGTVYDTTRIGREREHIGTAQGAEVPPQPAEVRAGEGEPDRGRGGPERGTADETKAQPIAGAPTHDVIPPVIRDVPPGSIDPKSIVPAVRLIGGKVVPGVVTDNLEDKDVHNDIIKRHDIKREDIDQKGFSDPEGKKFFLDREAAAIGTGIQPGFEPDRLHAPDLAKAQSFQPPEAPRLPRGLPEGERKSAFEKYREDSKAFGQALIAWEKAQPEKQPLIFESENMVNAITPNIGGGWRTTSFVKSDRMAWGHEVYKTRLEAVQHEVYQGNKRIDRIPFQIEPSDVLTSATVPSAEQPLPTAAKSGSVPLAAAETTTVRTATGREASAPRSTDEGKASEMTAEPGASPGRAAAAIRSDIRSATADLKTAEDRLSKFGKLRGEGKAVKQLQRKANQLRERITVLRGELSQVESARVRKGPAEVKAGITTDDGDLYTIVGQVGKLPAFLPPGWMVSQYRTLGAKVKAGSATPNERAQFQALMERFPPNFEDDFGVNGETMRQAYEAAKKAGIANELFNVVQDGRNLRVDTIADHIAQATGKQRSMREIYEMVANLAEAKRARESGEAIDAEGAAAEVDVRREENFKRDVKREKAGTQPLSPENLVENATFTLNGARFRVTEVVRDEDDYLQSVTLDDGNKYGTRTVEKQEDGSYKLKQGGKIVQLRMDTDSLKLPKAKEADWLTPEELAPEPTPAAQQPPVAGVPAGARIKYQYGQKVISPSTKEPGKFQTTWVDSSGNPIRDHVYSSFEDALEFATRVSMDLDLGMRVGEPEITKRPAKPVGPAVDLFGTPVEPAKPAAKPAAVQFDLLGGKEEVTPRPLTKKEQDEFQDLSLKARAARESGGPPLSSEETKRYDYLTALAGQKDLLAEDVTSGVAARLKSLREKRDEMWRQRDLAVANYQKAKIGSRFAEDIANWTKAIDDIQKQIAELERIAPKAPKPQPAPVEPILPAATIEFLESLAKKYGSPVRPTVPAEEPLETLLRARDMLERAADASNDPQELDRILELAKGLPDESRIAWNIASNKHSSDETFAKAKANEALHRMASDSAIASLDARRAELRAEPLPPSQAAAVTEAGKAAFPEGGAADGTEVNGFRKQNGRWYKVKEDGTLNKIPSNRKQHAQLEDAAKAPPQPPDERNPAEIIRQASQVRVRSKGGTFLRITTEGGRQAVVSLAEINTGDNNFRGVPFTKLEIGTKDADGKFKPLADQTDLKVEDLGKKAKGSLSPEFPSNTTVIAREQLRISEVLKHNDPYDTSVVQKWQSLPEEVKQQVRDLIRYEAEQERRVGRFEYGRGSDYKQMGAKSAVARRENEVSKAIEQHAPGFATSAINFARNGGRFEVEGADPLQGERMGSISTEQQPFLPYLKENLRYASIPDLRKAVADPSMPIPDYLRKPLDWLLSQPFVDQLPGLQTEIGDYLGGAFRGEYLPDKRIMRMLRFTSADGQNVAIHEFMHHVRMFIRPEDAQYIRDLRLDTIREMLAKAEQSGDKATATALRDMLNTPLESDEYVTKHYSDGLYHLSNEHEFFTWLFTEKAQAEMNKPEVRGFVNKMRELFRQIYTWARDFIGLNPREDAMWRQMLAGKYEFKVDDAMDVSANADKRMASLAIDPKDYELKRVLDAIGPQAGTIGGYLHRYETQIRLAEQLGTPEKARALDHLNRAREMTEIAQAEGGRINYYDARDNSGSLGEKNEAIRTAFESVNRYQQLGNRLRSKREQLTTQISSPAFRERLLRAAEKRDRAEMLAQVQRTFVNQISAAAGRISATLQSLKSIGTRADQLQSDLDRLRRMPDYSTAVAQRVDDIVNLMSTDEHGLSILLAGGNKSGSDIFDSYMARIPLTGRPMPTGDTVSLLRLASAVLAANRDLRNEFTVLNLVARDVISASDVNSAGRKIAEDLLNNPAKAVQRVARRAASLTDKATRAEAAWLALNRPVQKALAQWQMLDDAVRLHDAVENDAQYRQYVNDVMNDSNGVYIPNEIRQKLAAPGGKGREPFFEFSGIQTLYAPNGQEYNINVKWTPQTVGETIGKLSELKAQINDWLDDPSNQNSPSRQYWEERQRLIESSLMSSAIWNPSAMTPFHIGKFGFSAWGMPETFYQGLALPQAKLSFIATKNFDRIWTQGKGWYTKHQAVTERAIERGYASHPDFSDVTRADYQRSVINPIAWEFRHGREVHVGDVINGVRITREDMDLFRLEGRQINELYEIMWKAGELSGAKDVMEFPRIVDEFSGGAWGIRKAMEIGLHKGTTLPRGFSNHGKNLATNIHLILKEREDALKDLPARAVNMTPDEVQGARDEISDKYNRSMEQLLNDPDRFNNFVLSFMRQRSSDWLKRTGLSPFEEHYRQMTELVSQRDPTAPGVIGEVMDYLDAHTDAEWTPEAIRDQFYKEITQLTEPIYDLTSKNENSNRTIQTEKQETAFNKAFEADAGPSYFYDYGWIDAGEMRKYATDVASFAFNRMMVSMHTLRQNMSEAISEMTKSAGPWKEEQMRRVMGEYVQGKDFRDLQHLEEKLLELDRMIIGIQKWMGSDAMHAEGIALKSGARVISDFIGAALTGTRTAFRISGVSMGGSAWKMGNVFSQLGYGKLRSTPLAALSAIMSMTRLATATSFGWYFPEAKKLVPGIPLRMLMNVPRAARAAYRAKGAERLYQAIEASLYNTTDEQFAALKFWYDQKMLGMTPDNPVGARVAAILAASRSKGGVVHVPSDYTTSLFGKTWRGAKLGFSKVAAVPEAGLSWIMSYLPTGFGYNITYDAVGRQAGWYIDMLSAHARRTFDTYEKLNQLGRFNFDNLSDPKNKLAPWEVLPSFLGRIPFVNPAKLPSWARPNSTNLHFARELFSTSTDVDLQDLILRYWKRLSETAPDQRKNVEFMAPEEMDATAAQQRAEARARGIISRFVEQTHHAAPSNRPYWLQRATAFQSIMPFLGWSFQTIKQLDTYWGRAAFSAESKGTNVDSKLGLLVGAGLTALLTGAFAFLGGDFEIRLLRELDRALNRKETSLKTFDEVDTAKEKAEIIVHNMTAGIPLLNSALNTITGATGARGGQYGFQAFAFDKLNSVMNWIRGVYRTHDLTYGLDRLVEANLPISETIIENLFQRQGLQNSRNAVRVLQKFGPQDLVERRASASTSLPTELTPFRQDLINAVFSGKPELAVQAYQAFVQKAAELGRPEPDKVAAQVFGTLNPYRQAFGTLITDVQKSAAFARMSDAQREMVTKAEAAYDAAATAIGRPASFSKEEATAARSTTSTGVSGGARPSMSPVSGLGGGGRLRGLSSGVSGGTLMGGAGTGLGLPRGLGGRVRLGGGRLRAARRGGFTSVRRTKSFVRGRLRATGRRRAMVGTRRRSRRRGVYA